MDGRDEPRRARPIAEGLVDLPHADLNTASPTTVLGQALEQGRLRHRLAMTLGQALEDGKGLEREVNRLRLSPQARIGGVEPKGAK
jgi:hypothetical protein